MGGGNALPNRTPTDGTDSAQKKADGTNQPCDRVATLQ